MSTHRFNIASDHKDGTLRDAIQTLFAALKADKLIGDDLRIRRFVDSAGVHVLLVQCSIGGRWQTKLAMRADNGNLYIAGTLASSQNFDTLGWNPGS